MPHRVGHHLVRHPRRLLRCAHRQHQFRTAEPNPRIIQRHDQRRLGLHDHTKRQALPLTAGNHCKVAAHGLQPVRERFDEGFDTRRVLAGQHGERPDHRRRIAQPVFQFGGDRLLMVLQLHLAGDVLPGPYDVGHAAIRDAQRRLDQAPAAFLNPAIRRRNMVGLRRRVRRLACHHPVKPGAHPAHSLRRIREHVRRPPARQLASVPVDRAAEGLFGAGKPQFEVIDHDRRLDAVQHGGSVCRLSPVLHKGRLLNPPGWGPGCSARRVKRLRRGRRPPVFSRHAFRIASGYAISPQRAVARWRPFTHDHPFPCTWPDPPGGGR